MINDPRRIGRRRPFLIRHEIAQQTKTTLRAAALALLLAACGGGGSGSEMNGGNAAAPTANTISPSQSREPALGPTLAQPGQATWSAPLDLPLIAVAMAHLPTGKILMWASANPLYSTNEPGRTHFAEFDPVSYVATASVAANTGHDMFCPGTAVLTNGQVLVSGGVDSQKTSLFDADSHLWFTGAPMNIPRGYQANTLLDDGSVLTLGGSWNTPTPGNKHGEVWTAETGWRRLPGLLIDPMLGPEPADAMHNDNHMWLFSMANGRVLQAGPSINMNWLDTRGDGGSVSAGPRFDDGYAVNGNAAMFDIGKILKTGGAALYEESDANASAYLIDTTTRSAPNQLTVRKLAPMHYGRVFHQSVVLPNGQVLIVGGQTYSKPYSDDRAVLATELFDPASETFIALPPMTVPRTYHSSALLLPDARVIIAGGGLCSNECLVNHPNAQILTPHYLLNADGSPAARPVIVNAPKQAAYGATLRVETDMPISQFALIRLSANTHGVNNDQRRIPLRFKPADGQLAYTLDIPSNPGIALPGYYMLFALDARGVPSLARMVRIAPELTPRLSWPGDQASTVGTAVQRPLTVQSSDASAVQLTATGLPPGLRLDANPPAISGVPTAAGRYEVTLTASNGNGRVERIVQWSIDAPPP